MKRDKCICEQLQEKEVLYNTVIDNVVVEELSCEQDASLTMWHRRAFDNWQLAGEDGNSFAFISINYCPFCGRKLN